VEKNPHTSGTPGDRARKVLIVEDDAVTRKVYEHFVARHGCVVSSAPSAMEAMAELRRQTFDLIIVDAHLPDLHGADIARAARGRSYAVATPIIAVSYDDSDANVQLLREAGVDEFIVKPIGADQFRDLLERWLPG
jgi:DNA-binding response OmpR family regulator